MIQCQLQERKNTHSKTGKEWALNMQLYPNNWWTLTTWIKRPKDEIVTEYIRVATRAIEMYHCQLRFPRLDSTIVRLEDLPL